MARFQSGTNDVRLDGIAEPVNDDQAANKQYVDEHVVANPSGTDGNNLTRVTIDGTNYNIASGGGGGGVDTRSEVEALIGDTNTLVTIGTYTLVTTADPASDGQIRLLDTDGTSLTSTSNFVDVRSILVRGSDDKNKGVLARMVNGSRVVILSSTGSYSATTSANVSSSGEVDTLAFTSTSRRHASNGTIGSGSITLLIKPSTSDIITGADIVNNSLTTRQLNATDEATIGQVPVKHSSNTGDDTFEWVDRIQDDDITTARIVDRAVTADKIATDAVIQATIADSAVDEARLQISNTGTNGQFLQKQSGNTGGLTWASVTGGSGSGIETYADSTAYTAGTLVYSISNHHAYYVQSDVASTNTTAPPDNPEHFVDLGYLSKDQADALYLPRPSLGEALVTDLSGATTIADRADATGTIRVTGFIDSTTAQIGFWPGTYDFGNFPTSSQTFQARTSSTTWADLFTGNYSNIAMNFGASISNGFIQAFGSGHAGGNAIEIALRRGTGGDNNWAIWRFNGGYYGTEGHVIYFGRQSPTLVASQGSPGNEHLDLYLSLTSAGAYSAISTQLTAENVVIGGDGLVRQVGTDMIEDDAVTAPKLSAPADTNTNGPLITPNGGLQQGTDGRFQLSSAFVDAASTLALVTRYRYSTSIETGDFFFSQLIQDTQSLQVGSAPGNWNAIRSFVLRGDDRNTPSRSMASLASYFGQGSILEVRALETNSDGDLVRTGDYGIYAINESNFNDRLSGTTYNVLNITPADNTSLDIRDSGQTDGYGQSVYTGLIASNGSPIITDNTEYEITLHGRQRSISGTNALPRTIRNFAIADDTIAEAKLDIANAPSNARLLGWFGSPTGGEWRWGDPTLGVYRNQWGAANIGTGQVTPVNSPIADGQFILADTATQVGFNNLGSGESLSGISHIGISTITATVNGSNEDVRLASGHLKNNSVIHIERNDDSSHWAFLQITDNSPFSSGQLTSFRAVNVIASNGSGPTAANQLWNITLRPAPFMPTINDDLPDGEIEGDKLNVTATTTGATSVLSRDANDNLEEGPYADFSSSDAGIVNSPGTGTHPNPDTIANAIQTQPLRFTTNSNGILAGTRGWQLIHDGSGVLATPTTWDAFDNSADDVGLWISVEDLTAAERARLTAFGNSNDRNTLEVLIVNAEDHHSYMIANFGPDAIDTTDDTLNDGDGGHFVDLGGGSFTIVAQQGSPSANLKFYFPISLTGTVDLSETTPNADRFVDANNAWTELNVNPLNTLQNVLDTQLSPYRLVGYDVSSSTVKYKQWDTKIDGHIYHFTVFYNFTSGTITTAQVYHGHWTTTPTGTDATSFLFGTRTYTTTGGITTWSDSV